MAAIFDRELEAWPEKFETRQIHLVCVATNGLTTCDCAASTIGDLDQASEVAPLVRTVNRLGETGTFWPRLPLTIVPLAKGEGRPAPADLAVYLRRNFQDVAKANREHVRLKTLYVDLNGWGSGYDFPLARRIAEEVLGDDPDIESLYFAPESV